MQIFHFDLLSLQLFFQKAKMQNEAFIAAHSDEPLWPTDLFFLNFQNYNIVWYISAHTHINYNKSTLKIYNGQFPPSNDYELFGIAVKQ